MKTGQILIDPRKVKPNSWRNFDVDPIDEESVKNLRASIKDTGLWNGTVGRINKDGDVEIACRHTLLAAAIEAGMETVPIQLADYSDEEMIRIYTTENVTQRGELGSALFGAVASAVRYLLKGFLKGDEATRKNFLVGSNAEHQITNGDGIGYTTVLKFYEAVPAMNEGVIKHQLSNLKQSGEYAKIVNQVVKEIAKEEAAEQAELAEREKAAEEKKKKAEEKKKKAEEADAEEKAKADAEATQAATEQAEAEQKVEEKAKTKKTRDNSKKAAASAAKKAVTFDFKGVSKFLKKDNEIRAFKKVLNRPNLKTVPVTAQWKLAALLVKYANIHNKGKLTAKFIAQCMVEMIKNTANLKAGGDLDFEVTPEALVKIEQENAQHVLSATMHHFCRQWGGIETDADQMIKLKDEYPELAFNWTPEFKLTIKMIVPRVHALVQKLNIKV